ncbi:MULTISPECIES: SusC/RagA family TonB-linked outer membrane protein [Chitinophagaceae]
MKKCNLRTMMAALLLLCCNAAVLAQQKVNVTGKVLTDNGEELNNTTITVKAAHSQVKTFLTSDSTGTFHLYNLVPEEKYSLYFEHVGFVTDSMTNLVFSATETNNLLVRLKANALDAVVVTALGIKRQEKSLSYNVQQVSNSDLTNVKSVNFINSLTGKVAGVTINASSAGIGGATKVVMRGSKSIEQNSNALYVIDGIPLMSTTSDQGTGRFASTGSTEGIADLNPDDIESMSILTGAAAAALYGSAAANGAVLITTKKGSVSRIGLTYTTNNEWGKPFVMPAFQDKYGSDGKITSWGALLPENAEKYNPKDFFQTAQVLTNSVAVSGGSDKNQTYFSAASVNGKGLVPNNRYNRYNFTFRNTSYFLNGRLRIDGSANLIIQDQTNMINQGEYMNPLTGAYLLPRSDGLSKTKVFEIYDPSTNIYVQNWGDFSGTDGLYNGSYAGDITLQNPYWVAYRNIRTAKRNRYMLSLSTSYDIYKWSGSEKWDITARIRTDRTSYKTEDKRYASTIAVFDMGKNGYYGMGNGNETQTYLDVISNIKKNFGTDRNLSLFANMGASRQLTSADGFSYGGPLLDNGQPNGFNPFNIDQTQKATKPIPSGYKDVVAAAFASMEIGYKNYLFLTLTGRYEWPSQLFGDSAKVHSYFYSSAGLSAVVTDMLSPDVKAKLYPALSYLKVRTAYGSVGSPYQRWLSNPTYTFNQDSKTWSTVSYYPVANPLPERTNSFEVGISSKWLKNRLTFDITYYNALTKNQFIKSSISPSSGYNAFYIQRGRVLNSGIELALGYDIKNAGDFRWSTYYTLGFNRNRIKALAENYTNPITGATESVPFLVKNTFGSLQYVLKTGGSMGDVYTIADFKRNTDGSIYVDQDGNISIQNYADGLGTKLGSVFPDYTMGWKNQFSYKNLTLGATITGRVGGVVVSMTQASMDQYGVSQSSADARDAGGVIVNGLPYDAQKYYDTRGRNRLAQYYTYEATNFRVQEAYISYRFSKKLLKVADATLSISARNLLMLYNKAPFDPEVISATGGTSSSSAGNYVQGLDYYMLPSLRSYGINLKLNF